MKKIYLGIAAMTLSMQVLAQCLVTVTGSTNVSCFNGCNGSASLTTVGTPPYTYMWSSGQTVQNPNNLCAGTFTVVMTDASSCVATTTVTITQPPMLQDSSEQTDLASCDSCNGTATCYPYGGTPPFTHKWSTNPVQTTATATGLCPGTYEDTITDANNCQTILSVTIVQAAPLGVSATPTSTSSTTACDGGVTAAPTGGTPPYTYLWSPGNQTTASIIGQCPGVYAVCVTDSNGCSVCDTATVIAPTGMNEISYYNAIHVSPNPSSGQFIVACDKPVSNATIVVTNILGEIVFESAFKNSELNIDLRHLAKGAYIIKLNYGNGIASKRIIIQ